MNTDQRWPDPPGPGVLATLPITAPAVLLDALGYRGGDQYVAVYRGPHGVVWLDDGVRRDEGEPLAWHRFATHPVTEPLARYDLGGAGHDPTDRLLVDRDTNHLSIGRADDVAKILAGQAHTRDPLTGLRTVEPVHTGALHPDVRAARAPTGPGWQAHADRSGRLLDALTRALDGDQVQQHAADLIAEIGALSARTSAQLHSTFVARSGAGAALSAPVPADHLDGVAVQPVAAWSTTEHDPTGSAGRQDDVELS